VCDRWRDSFENFYADMGPRPSIHHSLDRINNDGHYEPSNCRWASDEEQRNNRSCSRYIEYAGDRLTVSQWARRLGFSDEMLLARLRRGYTVEQAITQPMHTRFRAPTQNGEQIAASKLTLAQVLEIKAVTGHGNVTKIARRLGITIGQASKIRHGKSWSHVA